VGSGRTRVVEDIRREILNGAWSPGERLQPAALAERFATSTTVVRESLSLLAGDGLITSRANHGFFVATLDLRELQDLTELRCATEQLAARLATERGDLRWEAELTAAHHTLARTSRRLSDDPDTINPAWAQAHREFHRALLAACDSPHIAHLAANLADSTELYRRWSAPSPAAQQRNVEHEHAALLAAALDRDGIKLGMLLREHYQATVDVVITFGLLSAAPAADPLGSPSDISTSR
jgi:DNA-binding GntR family transcriptional regulator